MEGRNRIKKSCEKVESKRAWLKIKNPKAPAYEQRAKSQLMRDLYEQLLIEGAPGIDRLISSCQQENVQLEFKTKADPCNGELYKVDRKNLGIILSAFANSMGGTVIWGVSAKQNDDKIDCAFEARPIAQLERFKSEIERAISQVILPRHDAIEVVAIPHASGDGSGYILIHVDRSDRRPHRCEYGEKQYFKRSGDSSIAMEHFDIEDSFKRIVVPKLSAGITLDERGERTSTEGPYLQLSIKFSLKNESVVTARYPYFHFTKVKNLKSFLDRPKDFIGGANEVIHPELSLTAARIIHEVRAGAEAIQPLIISYRFGCYNALPTTTTHTITPEEIMAKLRI